MRKHSLLPLLAAVIFVAIVPPRIAHAQLPAPPADTSEPSIVVLMPARVEIAYAVEEVMRSTNTLYVGKAAKGVAMAKARVAALKKDPKERAKLSPAEREELDHADELLDGVLKSMLRIGYVTNLTLSAADYLQYQLQERFRNLRTQYTADTSTLDPHKLAGIARRTGMRYVLSFPTVKIDAEEGAPFALVHGALFDSRTGRFLLDTTVRTTSENHGFAFACTEPVECTIINAVGFFGPAAAEIVTYNTPKVQYQMELSRARAAALLERYYGRPCPRRILDLVPRDSTLPDISAAYACLANSDTSKVVIFMAESAAMKMFEKNNRYGDLHINVEEDFQDTGRVSNTYAFILTGARVDGRWYFGKQYVTYFTADSLEAGRRTFFQRLHRFNFFRRNSLEPNPEFWETELFAKVEDPRLMEGYTPDDPYYKQMLEDDEPYIGMYRFVADKLRVESASR